jgi:hypothetical protein
LNLDPVFGRYVHIYKANNFHNYDFLTWHIKNGFSIISLPKRGRTGGFCEAATKGSVLNSTTPIFMSGGSCKKARSKI